MQSNQFAFITQLAGGEVIKMFVSYTLIKCVTNAAKEDLKPEQLHVAAASVECLTWRGGGGRVGMC